MSKVPKHITEKFNLTKSKLISLSLSKLLRSLSNAKLLSAFIVDRISVSASRRGYAGASQGVAVSGSGGARAAMAKKGGEEVTKTSSWVPDPKTRYCRPENHADDIDVAELREMLLKNNIRRH
ncbi:hypothetical protein HYC85_030727 [Camellia sinensis]|uniref:Uncharacterized protein n=1 Tax=Camellia sinensis TaxID=4442 RepID=A0A7J7G5J3_CAMSI|nr:hypothetical protein HYC85_030727 [Camellia sinensis]